MEAGGNSGDPAADTCAVVTVHIRCSNGSKFSVETSLDVTVAAFKVLVAGNCEVPARQQRLIYKGRILKDVQTLGSYDLQADHTIHLVRGAAPPPSANTASTPTAEVLRSTSGLSTGLDLGGAATVGGAGLGGSLFPGLSSFDGLGGSGVSGLFGSGLPEFEQVQQQLTQNPNIMREIMNMPVIQNLMNNPETMRSLIMNNPQMREIIDRNPDLGHILNDPSTLRQTLEAARNPELMREMMRNSDRAMSNIESSPEGFNMLRRMYETVQEPFLNATSMAGDAGSDLSSNPFSALLVGNQDPTNRTPNSLTTESDMTTGSPAPNTNPLPNPWNNNNATGGSRTNNTTSRSTNPSTNPGGAGIDGLAGLGLPELERMVGGLQDSPLISQVLQSPDMSQIMQSILSNPQYLNQILDLNPQIRIMMESNPQLGEMLRNPDFIRQMTSPETMQQVLDLQQSLLSLQGRQQSTQDLRETVGGPGTSNLGLEFLTSMLGGLGADGLAVPNPTNVPPEQLYAIQLTQLQEMGFFDTQENIRALIASAGNVHAAVERLLGNLGIVWSALWQSGVWMWSKYQMRALLKTWDTSN